MTEAKDSSAVSSPELADESSEAWGEREEERGGCWAAGGVPVVATAVDCGI